MQASTRYIALIIGLAVLMIGLAAICYAGSSTTSKSSKSSSSWSTSPANITKNQTHGSATAVSTSDNYQPTAVNHLQILDELEQSENISKLLELKQELL